MTKFNGQVSGSTTNRCCYDSLFSSTRKHPLCGIHRRGKTKRMSMVLRGNNDGFCVHEPPRRLCGDSNVIGEFEEPRIALLLDGTQTLSDELLNF